jgi:hypothetical protein
MTQVREKPVVDRLDLEVGAIRVQGWLCGWKR